MIGADGAGMALGSIPCLAYVNEADGSGMALGSIPWVAYVFWVVKKVLCNLSDSKSYFSINYFYKDYFNHIIRP